MTAPRSILVISPYRAEYGPARVLEHVLRALSDGGYRPVCVVPPGARLTDRLRALDPPVRELAALTTFPRTFNLFRLIRFFVGHLDAAHEIERIAREEEACAIYSVSEAIFAAPLAARRLGVPSVVHAIGMSISRPRGAARIYIRFLGRLTDQFVACSAAVAEMFAKHGVEDRALTVVHNAIDADEFEAASVGPPPTEHDGPRIGMFAAYDPRKGHELFMKAAVRIARVHPNARFYLVGGVLPEHPESRTFEEQVSRLIARLGLDGQVERPGYVPAPAVYDWMRAMDVVVVPSRTEAFAHALLEAMVCARPIVATAIEGNLDAFVHDHSGIYADPTAEAFAAAVAGLIDNHEAAAAIGGEARERARRFFDVHVAMPAIAQTVDNVLTRAESRTG